jgi:hypothetical protein
MQFLITNALLLLLTGGVGYLLGQAKPQWFGPELRDRLFVAGWIIALLLAGALRAAAVVYGPEAMFAVISVVGGFAFGIWYALRSANRPRRPRRP